MHELEAKDFLVQQAAEQAALEKVPLSDLEKRMMYFTESGEMREDAVALNEAFEAEYDSDEYEVKISKLLHHAYTRIEKENPETARRWNQALKQLSSGDNYLSVLWGRDTGERPPYDSLKLLGTALLLIIVMEAILFTADHYGLHWPKPDTRSVTPKWIQRLLFGLMIGAYIYSVVLPWIMKKPPMALSQLVLRLFRTPKRNNSPK
jgi:hypothetical protein